MAILRCLAANWADGLSDVFSAARAHSTLRRASVVAVHSVRPKIGQDPAKVGSFKLYCSQACPAATQCGVEG